MRPRTIEGTWEEVERLAGELAGRRVRATVLDDARPGGEASPPVANPIMGMFGDSPELLDEVVEEAMRIREERPWRLPAGE